MPPWPKAESSYFVRFWPLVFDLRLVESMLS